jgi:hypothetical protein
LILESIAITQDAAGRLNVAPMGPLTPDAPAAAWTEFRLRPFITSQTFANLEANPAGVLHVTDDVLLFAQAVLGRADPPTRPAEAVAGRRLEDCCSYFEFEVVGREGEGDRPTLIAAVRRHAQVRPWYGFNRAKHAVLEAAILISRLEILPFAQIAADLARLEIAVTKTAGAAEFAAFALLKERAESFARERS